MKKLQIFISSTYTDLVNERQAAVESILRAGHIPAGMELFKAGDEAQWTVIKKWIDESDAFLLILGGRYGSIEPSTGKSYVQLEYEYAVKKNKKPFAIVISEEALKKRVVSTGKTVLEDLNCDKYYEFRKNVLLNKICRMFNDEKDVQLSIYETLKEYEMKYQFTGWVSGEVLLSDADKYGLFPPLKGEFNHSICWSIKTGARQIETDIDGDSHMELITIGHINGMGYTISIKMGKETFFLFPKLAYPFDSYYCQLAIKDVNNDGMPEILFASRKDSMTKLFIWSYNKNEYQNSLKREYVIPFKLIGEIEGNNIISILYGGVIQIHHRTHMTSVKFVWDGKQFKDIRE